MSGRITGTVIAGALLAKNLYKKMYNVYVHVRGPLQTHYRRNEPRIVAIWRLGKNPSVIRQGRRRCPPLGD